MLLPGVLVRSGWDKQLLLLPFSTSPVFSMGGVFEFCAVCSPVLFPSEAKRHKHKGERKKRKVTQGLKRALLSYPFLNCLDATTLQCWCSFAPVHFARSSLCMHAVFTYLRMHMRSAACVCVCVFYKLELEPSGLIMWPGNYTGLSEETRAAYDIKEGQDWVLVRRSAVFIWAECNWALLHPGLWPIPTQMEASWALLAVW